MSLFLLIITSFGIFNASAQSNGYGNVTAQDESAREDRLTGGKIERATLQPGDTDIRITVDVPAFLMTLWQGNKEIAVYNVGVGQKDYPIVIGQRTTEQIIVNPDWYPPDSDWVRESNIKPFTRITAKDPRNPLGKIKIPLGGGYLLHQAKGYGDMGSLVSHGCVRVLVTNLFDISKKIAVAYNLPTSGIDKGRTDKKQRILTLDEALNVDINYDTMVVERGILHVYPDVYDYKTNTLEKFRAQLQSYNIGDDEISDATLQKILARVKGKTQFAVSLADIKAGKALTRGKSLPVVGKQSKS